MFTSRLFTRIVAIASVLMLALSNVQPTFAAPTNDYFADATQISSLPYSSTIDTTGATFEVDEPYACAEIGTKSVWFSYTPSTKTTLITWAGMFSFSPILAVYSGTSLGSLTLIGCGSDWYTQRVFEAQAGTTYYFQLSGWNGGEGNTSFSLDAVPPPPPPQVNIVYGPTDPSTFDNVWFTANIFDQGGIYGNLYAWTFSDGTTSDQSGFYHQFTADGDYTVNLTFTTYDGRSGSASQVIQVRTNDVAITRFSVPQTARVNQTKTINVDLKNNRRSEYVQVTLFKGLLGGGEQVIGTLTIYVPARATRTTTFKFSYTFTPDDATIGKAIFRAVATIVNFRDVLPSDNTSIATTTVSK